MTISLSFFLDAGLTTPLSSLAVAQQSDGAGAAEDRVIYLGSPVASKRFRDAASPGVAQINVSITDMASGTGAAASAVKLATSAAGLATATAGAALTLGTQINSGVGGAVAIYIRIDTPALAEATYNDLGLHINNLIEST